MLFGKAINDPVFGKLTYRKADRIDGSDPVVGYWEGRSFFAPLEREVQIDVLAEKDGPSEAQRVFYREIERRWEDLQPELNWQLFKLLVEWFGAGPQPFVVDLRGPSDIAAVLQLAGLQLGHVESRSDSFALYYGIKQGVLVDERSDGGHAPVARWSAWKIVRVAFE